MIGLGLGLGNRSVKHPVAELPAYFKKGTGTRVGLAPGVNGAINFWSEIADGYAISGTLDATNTSTRLSWRETRAIALRRVYPIGEITLSSGWSKLQSSGSGLAGSYTGNRSVSTTSTGATADVTVDRNKPYDLWVIYTGRTNGGYCRVEIDGAQTLVNEIDDPAALGFKAFSTYSDVNLSRRIAKKVASGLTGSHYVRVRNGGAATPGSSNLHIEAVAITGGVADAGILPPIWQPETIYEAGDEVQYGGYFYAARANGQSGLAGPTHSNGIASDGALDWRADTRSTYHQFAVIDYASEKEYAANFALAGQNGEVGGQTHNGETLTARQLLIDGQTWVPTSTGTGISSGSTVSIIEETTWTHPANNNVASCALTRTLTPGEMRHDLSITPFIELDTFAWFYPAMLPFARWDGETKSDVFNVLEYTGGGQVPLDPFAGQIPSDQVLGHPARLGLKGYVIGETLRYGFEHGSTSGMSDAFVFVKPNIGGGSAAGSTDWIGKAYVQGLSGSGGFSFHVGSPVSFSTRHVFNIEL